MDTADDHESLVARLQARAALKAKYHRLQNKYARALEVSQLCLSASGSPVRFLMFLMTW